MNVGLAFDRRREFRLRPRSARFEPRLGDIRPAGALWLAEVEVRNLAGETAQATRDHVPAHSRDSVALVFDADPRAAEVSISGWSKP